MKRRIQERIYEETRGLSREAELEYFHAAGASFWEEMASLRSEDGVTVPPEKTIC
jgi:hypothetical protein